LIPNPKIKYCFDHLKSFELIAHISPIQETMEKILAIFPDHDVSTNLNLATFSNQEFFELLQIARDFPKERNAKIGMRNREFDLKSFDRQFQQFLKTNKNDPIVENVMLEINNSVTLPDASVNLLKETSKIFKNFSLFEIFV